MLFKTSIRNTSTSSPFTLASSTYSPSATRWSSPSFKVTSCATFFIWGCIFTLQFSFFHAVFDLDVDNLLAATAHKETLRIYIELSSMRLINDELALWIILSRCFDSFTGIAIMLICLWLVTLNLSCLSSFCQPISHCWIENFLSSVVKKVTIIVTSAWDIALFRIADEPTIAIETTVCPLLIQIICVKFIFLRFHIALGSYETPLLFTFFDLYVFNTITICWHKISIFITFTGWVKCATLARIDHKLAFAIIRAHYHVSLSINHFISLFINGIEFVFLRIKFATHSKPIADYVVHNFNSARVNHETIFVATAWTTPLPYGLAAWWSVWVWTPSATATIHAVAITSSTGICTGTKSSTGTVISTSAKSTTGTAISTGAKSSSGTLCSICTALTASTILPATWLLARCITVVHANHEVTVFVVVSANFEAIVINSVKFIRLCTWVRSFADALL